MHEAPGSVSGLQANLEAAIKSAMKAQEKGRLAVLRMMAAALKQFIVDDRIREGGNRTLTDAECIRVLDKMLSQRRESIAQFQRAEPPRQDLVEKEQFEMSVIQSFLPEPLTEAEVKAEIEAAVVTLKAVHLKDMAKVMAHLKPVLQGRADMGQVGSWIKVRLSEASP